jgi:hypothetical protein
MERQELATLALDHVGGHTLQLAIGPCEHGGVVESVDKNPGPRDSQRIPVSQERLDDRSILELAWRQFHYGSVSHRTRCASCGHQT